MATCLIENCGGDAQIRGLCWNCYQNALRYVRKGKTTWKELEEAGFANPPTRQRNASLLRKALNKRSLKPTNANTEIRQAILTKYVEQPQEQVQITDVGSDDLPPWEMSSKPGWSE
jgi:hypothetical protein